MFKRKIRFFATGVAFLLGCFVGGILDALALNWALQQMPALEPLILLLLLGLVASCIVCGTLTAWWLDQFFERQ